MVKGSNPFAYTIILKANLMLDITIIVPLDDNEAIQLKNSSIVESGNYFSDPNNASICFPEVAENGIPKLDSDTVAGIHKFIVDAISRCKLRRLTIITRSQSVIVRVQRMIAEGMPIQARVRPGDEEPVSFDKFGLPCRYLRLHQLNAILEDSRIIATIHLDSLKKQ